MTAYVLTVGEAATLLRRHPSAIRRMLKSGELRGVNRRGGGWVLTESIEQLLGAPLNLADDRGKSELVTT